MTLTRGTTTEAAPGLVPARPGSRGTPPWRRLLRNEFVAMPVAAVAIAVAMTWPALRRPAGTLPGDLGDPALVTYLLGWGGHAMRTDPAHLWDTNAFYPEHDTLAFSDSLLGYLPFGLIGTGPTAALVRYNVLFVLVAALAFVGAYALARQLGARWQGAALAGAAFAYAPWRISQAGHLHVLSTGGIALALAMLARGHGFSLRTGYSPSRARPGWAAAGWAVACWQLLIGFGVGLPFVYVLLLLCAAAAAGWLLTGRPRLPRRLLLADGLGGLAFAAVGALMAQPYLRVVEDHPYARRGLLDVQLFSPPFRGFFLAPADSLVWGPAHAAGRETLVWAPEMALFPGLVLLVLGSTGLLVSVWRGRHRLLLAAGGLLALALAMGTAGPWHGRYTYLPLLDHLPGWDGIRTPGRLVLWLTLVLCLLAAGAVTALLERRPTRVVGLALLLPAALVLGEGVNTVPQVPVPPQPPVFDEVRGPMIVLPSDYGPDVLTMVWNTDRYVPMVNGGSGVAPLSQYDTRAALRTFPDRASVARLRHEGIRTVVVFPARLNGTPWQGVLSRPIGTLPVRRERVGDAVVFTVRAPR
ncbi:MAG TPA: hypothetical protein VGO94_02110 [Mycobacteriales bacterium]|nr:hypothetical protein [Mycobacteriales bacterium]